MAGSGKKQRLKAAQERSLGGKKVEKKVNPFELKYNKQKHEVRLNPWL